jgi:glycosyltransferase involved in cell wall biosynthesis
MPDALHAAASASILTRLDVDIVHDHSFLGPLGARGRSVPTVVTTHGPVLGELGDYYRHLGTSVELVALSDAQRQLAPNLNWAGTVHNSVCVADFPYRSVKQSHALFLGRMAPEKGLATAIDAAATADIDLVVATKAPEEAERQYFETEIVPRLNPHIYLIGEADGFNKRQLLADARCLLFPIDWEEPFGMVMIEALACGTPVVALNRGSVPEVIRDGVTGLICDYPRQLPAALDRVTTLDPRACRLDAEKRFNVGRMTQNYLGLYREILRGSALDGPVGFARPH